MTDREEFEKWYKSTNKGELSRFEIWQAADEIERLKAETQEPMIIKQENGMVLKLGYDELPNGTAFYTTPSREWQSLSDEEIKEIHNASVGKDIGFATGLTEEKLKEKNNVT